MVTMMLSSCPCLLTEKLREVSSSVAFLNMLRISLREGWMFRSFSENNHEILRVCHMIQKSGAYAGGGGCTGCTCTPPPTWKKNSAQKCSKEERKFRPDMLAKMNVRVPLRYDKIKTKNVGKKEDMLK